MPTFPFKDRCDEPLLDHPKHTPVTNPARNAPHQSPVRDRAEVVAEIRIDDIGAASLGEMKTHLPDCPPRIPSLPEPELLVRAVRIKDGVENGQHRRLYPSAPDCRHPERALTTASLRYPHSQQGLGRVRFAPQLLLQVSKPLLQPTSFNLFERQAVHTGSTTLSAARAIGVTEHVCPADLVPQAVESIAWFGLSFHV